jgi:hypothetical protein
MIPARVAGKRLLCGPPASTKSIRRTLSISNSTVPAAISAHVEDLYRTAPRGLSLNFTFTIAQPVELIVS